MEKKKTHMDTGSNPTNLEPASLPVTNGNKNHGNTNGNGKKKKNRKKKNGGRKVPAAPGAAVRLEETKDPEPLPWFLLEETADAEQLMELGSSLGYNFTLSPHDDRFFMFGPRDPFVREYFSRKEEEKPKHFLVASVNDEGKLSLMIRSEDEGFMTRLDAAMRSETDAMQRVNECMQATWVGLPKTRRDAGDDICGGTKLQVEITDDEVLGIACTAMPDLERSQLLTSGEAYLTREIARHVTDMLACTQDELLNPDPETIRKLQETRETLAENSQVFISVEAVALFLANQRRPTPWEETDVTTGGFVSHAAELIGREFRVDEKGVLRFTQASDILVPSILQPNTF